MKHRALILSNIINLGSQLEASIEFGESMNDRQTSHKGLRTAAKIAAGVGVGALGLHGAGQASRALRGLKVQPLNVRSSASELHKRGVQAVAHARRGVDAARDYAKGFVHSDGLGNSMRDRHEVGRMHQGLRSTETARRDVTRQNPHGGLLSGKGKAMESVLGHLTQLSAGLDEVLNFDSDSGYGPAAATAAGAGAAGAGGLYAAGLMKKRKALQDAIDSGDPDAIAAARKAAKAVNVGSHIVTGAGVAKQGAGDLVSGIGKFLRASDARRTTDFRMSAEDKKRTVRNVIAGTALTGAGILAGRYGHHVPGIARGVAKGVQNTARKATEATRSAAAHVSRKAGELHGRAKEAVGAAGDRMRQWAGKKDMSAVVAQLRQFAMDTNGGTKPMVQKQKNPQKNKIARTVAATGAAAVVGVPTALYLRGRLGNGGGTRSMTGNVAEGYKRAKGDVKKLGGDAAKATISTGRAINSRTQNIVQMVKGKIAKLAAKAR